VEAEKLYEFSGGEFLGQEFLKILAEMLANSVMQDLDVFSQN
jgi:hypothetical protein